MNYIIAILVIGLSIFLFKKASGTLKINLINVSSYVFYILMAFEFVGLTLIYLGFRDHYIIGKLNNNNVINIAYWSMSYAMIILPITMILANRYIFKIKNMKTTYIDNINKEIVLEDNKVQQRIFIFITIALVICFLAMIYVFYCIGYIPFFKYFDNNFDYATERININREFDGNVYVKNIIMVFLTPLLSYIAYIYMRTTKQKKWLVLFIISFVLSIVVKTYDFSKAPIIYYICFFFIIEVMLGKTKKLKKIIPYLIITIILVLVLYYVIMGYNGNILSLTGGPMSRVIMSQAGALLLHFDAFPEKIDYLGGHSFPPFTKIIFGDGEYDVRSGRSVMALYFPENIENGTAGVMSTVFLGEAYANFGFVGVAISPIVVGLIFSAILCIYLKSKKTPLNIILYLECFIIFTNVLNAGFIDFFYNVNFILTLMLIFGLKILSSENLKEKTKKLVNECKNKFIKRNGKER